MAAGKAFSFNLTGAEELQNAFLQLPKATAKSVLRAAATKALAPVRNEAEGYALTGGQGGDLHRRTGRYADSWKISTKLNSRQRAKVQKTGAVVVYVGSNDPKAHLLEFGHKTVDGGFVKPFTVLRPAWDEKKAEVLTIFKTEIWTQLLRAAKRLNKKATKLAGQLGR